VGKVDDLPLFRITQSDSQLVGSDKPITLLVVEDNPGDLTLLRQALASVPSPRFEISHASTLLAGLTQLRYGMDIILLDLDFPDSRGLDTLKGFRAPMSPFQS
jgi:DNA-binding response OmpR family regulator